MGRLVHLEAVHLPAWEQIMDGLALEQIKKRAYLHKNRPVCACIIE